MAVENCKQNLGGSVTNVGATKHSSWKLSF